MQTDLGPEMSNNVQGRYVYSSAYVYSDDVVQSDNFLKVVPRPDDHTFLDSYQVTTSPAGSSVEFTDEFGNRVNRVKISKLHRELIIVSMGSFRLKPWLENYQDLPIDNLQFERDATTYLNPSQLIDPIQLREKAKEITKGSKTFFQIVNSITQWIYKEIKYTKGATTIGTKAHEVLSIGAGVCQDKAHLALGMLRALSIPSRYVSAILTEQVGDTHAYVEFLHPLYGWLPTDPTKGIFIMAGTKYLKLGIGRDYADVSPVTGTFISKGQGKLDRVIAAVQFNDESIIATKSTLSRSG